MIRQPFRLATGGAIDRDRPLRFEFDGTSHWGYAGDTLASALLANGVRLVGRSFKYHRPRGIYTAGPEEPNALVRLRRGGRAEPNTRATMIELFEGLVAESQNRFPSIDLDFGAAASLLAPLFPAGFYYKTFMWPRRGWKLYEYFIRRAAGLGVAPREPDPDRYDKRRAYCDVLVVGAGPAGIAAACEAGRAGARVILLDERPELGGALHVEGGTVEGVPAAEWLSSSLASLAAMPEMRLLPRTTAFGYYDHNMIGAVERVAEHLPEPGADAPRKLLWTIRAKQVVLATGAIERPLVFANNDRPGIMLASAARAYVNRYGVRPGSRAVVFTNNDSAYDATFDLRAAGIEIAALVDSRAAPPGELAARARAEGLPCRFGQIVAAVEGRRAVRATRIAPVGGADGGGEQVACDLVAISGGWSPTIHLHCQSGGRPVYDDALAAFLPGSSKQAERSAGAAAGHSALSNCVGNGAWAGAAAAAAAGFGRAEDRTLTPLLDRAPAVGSLYSLESEAGRRKCFVDLQNDVTTADIALAAREGFRSVEHVKRYTTLGMGTDQGKTSNVNGLALLAGLRAEAIPKVGTTTFRPPYTPVTLGAFAGRDVGHHFEPTRRSPMHRWHEEAGAVFVDAGLWLRPRYYPRAGENMAAAVLREIRGVRDGVGLVDVTTLGKIELQGPDAAVFLDRVFVNNVKTLAVGRARYCLMLREDGLVLDDGTCSRLGETRYLMTTTTAHAVRVMQHLERLLQVDWPELRVQATSVTEQWAAMALAGPRSRRVLERVVEGFDVSNAGFRHMSAAEVIAAGVRCNLFRMSYSGELAYEIHVPSDFGSAVWQAVLDVGASEGIIPYGTEAMGVMRIEKGHVAGAEIDGRATADDLGLGRLAGAKTDFVGWRSLARPGFVDPARKKLVGLVPVNGRTRLRAGAHLVEDAAARPPVPMLGHVTSPAFSPTLGHPIALAFLSGGLARKGQILHAAFPLAGETVPVRVVDPVFVDPKGERLNG
jgi:heterotetrameric sarcosine oxidase alpha subunit